MKMDLSKVCRCGWLRLEFIKCERQELYTQLLFSGSMEEYLVDVDMRVKEHIWELTKQIADRQGITEKLKTDDQMAWINAMNAIKAQAEEMAINEIIEE